MFSSDFYEISKNTFFTEHLRWLLLSGGCSYLHFQLFFFVLNLFEKSFDRFFNPNSTTAAGVFFALWYWFSFALISIFNFLFVKTECGVFLEFQQKFFRVSVKILFLIKELTIYLFI